MSKKCAVIEHLGAVSQRFLKVLPTFERGIPVLITGIEGAGQSAFAEHLAQAYLCMETKNEKPCGECSACRNFEKNLSPDLLTVRPKGKSDWIRMGQIRLTSEEAEEIPVSEFMRTEPVQAKTKVVLIFEAERLTREAADGLLRLLEEAPPYARYILTTSAEGKIIPTIRSRCLRVPCGFEEDEKFSEAARALSLGAPESALKLDSPELYEWSQSFYSWIRNLRKRSKGEALVVSEEFLDFCKRYIEANKDTQSETRASQAEVIQYFSNGLMYLFRTEGIGTGEMLRDLLEMHRALQGNVRLDYLSAAFFMRNL
ncbi:MAG TPA: hypothetical protein VNK96_09230 [Fimbriimonadales bacterium]|nr:hypothetical protein [Fimbriimonadales bacterium]